MDRDDKARRALVALKNCMGVLRDLEFEGFTEKVVARTLKSAKKAYDGLAEELGMESDGDSE